LVEHFLKKHQRGDSIVRIPPDVMQILIRYDWPGNVRELENICERVVVLDSPDFIRTLGIEKKQMHVPGALSLPPEQFEIPYYEAASYKDAKRELLIQFEKKFFQDALDKAGGNISEAARSTGMHRKNFYEKLEQLGLTAKKVET